MIAQKIIAFILTTKHSIKSTFGDNLDLMRVGIIDVNVKQGGVRTFIDNFTVALEKQGFEVKLIDFQEAPLSYLNSFDILHFSRPYLGIQSWKLLFITHPKKVLTIHGWIKKEFTHYLKNGYPSFIERVKIIMALSTWQITVRLFDLITCPSKTTANENGLKSALIVSNAIFPDNYCKIPRICIKSASKEIVFSTYSSVGGLKDESVSRVIEVITKLNKLLVTEKITLLVFGVSTPKTKANIKFMGYHPDFLSYLKGSDLFITAKQFPDLGYVEMEAGALGVPIAKYVTDCALEELIDNITGILAKNDDELLQKLLNFISNIDNTKLTIGLNLRDYIIRKKSWDKVAPIWTDLFELLNNE